MTCFSAWWMVGASAPSGPEHLRAVPPYECDARQGYDLGVRVGEGRADLSGRAEGTALLLRVPSRISRSWSMRTTRSASRATSTMSCVVSRTGRPRSSTWCRRNSRACSFATTSIPMVGSSRRRPAGRAARAAARPQRTRWPGGMADPDVPEGGQFENFVELPQPGRMLGLRHLVDVPQNRERLTHREVSPQLGPLPAQNVPTK